MFSVIFAIDWNCAGMVLRMSRVRRDVIRDRFVVAGILTNDGCGCGSHEKFFSRKWVVVKFGLRKV